MLVDVTSPVTGHVADGLLDGEDVEFASDPAIVAAHWEGFYDPESGLDTASVAILRKHQGL